MTTVDRRILPAVQAQLIDAEGRATPAMYDFMRRIVAAQSDPSGGGAPIGASYVTFSSESVLPNSWRIIAGDGITMDTSVPGRMVLRARSGDGYPAQLGHAGI